jgi:hypothetical protein
MWKYALDGHNLGTIAKLTENDLPQTEGLKIFGNSTGKNHVFVRRNA